MSGQCTENNVPMIFGHEISMMICLLPSVFNMLQLFENDRPVIHDTLFENDRPIMFVHVSDLYACFHLY